MADPPSLGPDLHVREALSPSAAGDRLLGGRVASGDALPLLGPPGCHRGRSPMSCCGRWWSGACSVPVISGRSLHCLHRPTLVHRLPLIGGIGAGCWTGSVLGRPLLVGSASVRRLRVGGRYLPGCQIHTLPTGPCSAAARSVGPGGGGLTVPPSSWSSWAELCVWWRRRFFVEGSGEAKA